MQRLNTVLCRLNFIPVQIELLVFGTEATLGLRLRVHSAQNKDTSLWYPVRNSELSRFLWPPIAMGRPLYFAAVVSIYISVSFFFFFFFFFFFLRLISAVADWMSTVLPHMMKCAACGLLEIQDTKLRQNSPSAHHRTTLSGNIFATKVYVSTIEKRVKPQYLLYISSQYGELWPTNG